MYCNIRVISTDSDSNSRHCDKGATESKTEPKDKRSRTNPSGGMLH